MQILAVSKAIVVNPDGKILLLRRSASDERRPNEWDIPGGHVDVGEYPAEAVARETQEEAGIGASPKDMALAFAMTESPKEGLSVTWLFHCYKTDERNITLSHEHSEYAWVSFDEALEMITYHRQKRALQYVRDNSLLTADMG